MSAPDKSRSPEMAEEAIWQRVEFGNYGADLPFWVELASDAGGPVLELGAGAGRVAIHLAGHGHEVIAWERERELAEELQRAAERLKTSVHVIHADLASPTEVRLPTEPSLVIGPLHVVQLLDGASRLAVLARLRELVAPGAIFALTVVDESTLLTAGASSGRILPDMQEVGDWVFSSEPLWVQVSDDTLMVRRIRERVSPDGAIDRSVHDEVLHRVSAERLQLEADEVGLVPAGRRQINYGPNEADSTVVLLEAR